MSTSNQSAGRRLSTITIDQIISGLSSFLIAILAARVLGVEAFGLFGIVFIIYVTGQGAMRAMVSEPMLVHPVEAEERPGDAIGTAGALGLAAGGLIAAGGLLVSVWDDRLSGGLIVLGVCLPLMGLQDLGRYIGFATHRPSFSLRLDLFWVALMVAAVGALVALDKETLTWFVVAWAGSGAASGLPVVWRYRKHKLRPSLSWLRETWAFARNYLISFTAVQGAALAAAVGAVVIAGVRALGAIRGTMLLVRPFGMVQAAFVAAGVAEVARFPRDDDRVRRHVWKSSTLTAAVAVANMVALLLVPDAMGRLVLGATWEPTEPLLLPASIQMVLLALTSGPRSAMVGRRAIRTTVRIDIVSTVVVLAATYTGAFINDALGAFWALAIGQLVVTGIWWLVYSRHSGLPETGEVVEDSATATSTVGQ